MRCFASFHASTTALAAVLLFAPVSTGVGRAQSGCDVNGDGAVNASDLNALVSMVLGTAPCGSGLQAIGGCNAIAVQRVVNVVTGGACSTTPAGNLHGVTVTWVASVTGNVVGYNLYRATSLTGNYTRVNSALISGTSYTDNTVSADQTYIYAATSVDNGGNESMFSTTAGASVPSP